jgi:CheY-like chemotaxis protein
MSHEIRTPMNAIIGMINIAESSDSVDRKDYAIAKIKDASVLLLGVINDILDLSKIEANKLELSPVKFACEDMVRMVVNIINLKAIEKHQDFKIHIDKNMPKQLIGDDQRIAQVLTNLLSNAVKFTPDYGKVNMDIGVLKREGNCCRLQFQVADTGVGISREQQDKLFNSFEQADINTTRKFGGTGLGLAISKRIVEMMDGKIWVESEPGAGSVFTFTIMAGIPAQDGDEPEPAHLSIDFRDIRVLMVDDDVTILDQCRDLLEKNGISCDVATNGDDAIKLIMNGEKYNLYFIDWMMPGINGIELTKYIREIGSERSVITMISSVDWNLIKADARIAGADGFLSKPINSSALLDSIYQYIGDESSGAADKKHSDRARNYGGNHILLAEDVEINREIVLTLLEPTGIKTDCATNGLEALTMFSENPDRYDLIFMDVQMPEMDGYLTTRSIRTMDSPRAGTIPIIAMTANVFKEDIDKCIEAGMNDHIGKPLNFDDVLATLDKYL